MKDKITISLDENILKKIDNDVKNWKWKNRSQIIENVLHEKYWDFVDVTVIIFTHDYKWDNRPYPFDVPKWLLDVKWKSVIYRQIEIFSSVWITNIILTIPKETKALHKKELESNFKNIKFEYVELEKDVQTWDALKKALEYNFNNNIIISNWDIYYGNLNLENYFNYHKEQWWDFSFLLKFVSNPEQLWNVIINWNKIIWFVEKPKANALYLTNSWLYITTKKFLEKNDFWSYLEYEFFPKLHDLWNIIWYIYSWQWEHIQNDSAYERVNWWNI